MYRVIVVDDEIWSVIGLTKILREDAQHFELIYETTNSLDALEKICQLQPDVVFTDVRMPEMSGLELMHIVHERGLTTQFVVISGYAEFSYVQQALHEGAIDYHLKPFDRNTAKPMLDRLYEKLESQRPAGDSEFYFSLLDKKENVADLLQSKFGRSLYRKLQVVFLYREAGAENVQLDVGDKAQCLPLKIGPRKTVCILNSDEDKTELIREKLKQQTSRIEKAAISRASDSTGQLEQLVMETEITIRDSFVYPDEKIFSYRKPRRDVIVDLENQIGALYQEKKTGQIAKVIGKLGAIFTDHNMGVEDAVSFWNAVAMHSAKRGSNPQLVLDYLDVFELSERFADISEMSIYLTQQYMGEKREESQTVNDKFQEMLRYIDENYAEPLYLKELCNMFYINMSYCCELFQKHEKMTFSQYLTHVRIRKACELLKYRGATVSEACELVGYKDYFYFNKVFKKRMGCTPAEYRKSELTEI